MYPTRVLTLLIYSWIVPCEKSRVIVLTTNINPIINNNHFAAANTDP